MDELKSNSTNFDELCNSASEIQQLTRSGNKGHTGDKKVHISSIDGEGTFKGKCRNCGKVCGFKAKECKKHKGELHSGCSNGKSEGKINNGGSGKRCNFCSLKGHNETGCFKKFPEKALAWYKEKTVKAKSAASSMEVTLASLNPEKLGINVLKLCDEDNEMLAILHQENVWICDTGASIHVMWNNNRAKNIQDKMMYSLGHAGLALESTALIDIPGVFRSKSGEKGLQAY